MTGTKYFELVKKYMENVDLSGPHKKLYFPTRMYRCGQPEREIGDDVIEAFNMGYPMGINEICVVRKQVTDTAPDSYTVEAHLHTNDPRITKDLAVFHIYLIVTPAKTTMACSLSICPPPKTYDFGETPIEDIQDTKKYLEDIIGKYKQISPK